MLWLHDLHPSPPKVRDLRFFFLRNLHPKKSARDLQPKKVQVTNAFFYATCIRKRTEVHATYIQKSARNLRQNTKMNAASLARFLNRLCGHSESCSGDAETARVSQSSWKKGPQKGAKQQGP